MFGSVGCKNYNTNMHDARPGYSIQSRDPKHSFMEQFSHIFYTTLLKVFENMKRKCLILVIFLLKKALH